MYTPPAFAMEDTAAMHALIDGARLATLISNGADGIPDISHLPLLREGDTLVGHLARANGHWRALGAAGRAVAVFHGPEAYVSPSAYAAKREHGRVVPTWNYVVVHAAGRIELVEDSARLHGIVDRLTSQKEAGRATPWPVDDAPAPFIAGQLKGIVGVLLHIQKLSGKRKLSQNRQAADRAGVVAVLEQSTDPRDHAVAEAMVATGKT